MTAVILGILTAHALPTSFKCAPGDHPDDCAALQAVYRATGSVLPWGKGTSVCTWNNMLYKYAISCDNQTKRVTSIDLTDNHLSGTLPTDLGKLSYLEGFLIGDDGGGGNSLSGSFPREFWSLRSLQFVILNHNHFSDLFIPAEVGNMSSLGTLALEDVNLTGTIPPEIGKIQTLAQFVVSDNYLSGSLPDTIGKISSMYSMDLQPGNAFSGTVPASMGSLTNMVFLGLSGFGFSGTIATQLGNLSSVSIDFSIQNTRISGTIPSELGNLKCTGSLSLDNQRLSGTIPSQLGRMPQMWTYLGHNQISGSIPSQVGRMGATLAILGVGENRLSGSVPTQVGQMAALQRIYAAGNRLSGSLPTEIGGLGQAEVLALQSNRLTGEMPSQVGKLGALTNLALSDNRLSGLVPEQLCLVNLTRSGCDLRNNTFRCPLPACVKADCQVACK